METLENLTDACTECDTPAMASTPRGRMCGGHALLETTREWNQGNWTFTATFDPTVTPPPGLTYAHLIA